MNEEDIMEQTGNAYLCLIHPILRDDVYREEIASVVALAPSVPDELVAAMITGRYWRERLVGLCMAMCGRQATFVESIVQSLQNPGGIAIVPACAACAVLARRGIYAMNDSFSQMFDRSAFDGEVGWAADKAAHFAGLRSEDVPGRGPNYGQNFEDHAAVYSWLFKA